MFRFHSLTLLSAAAFGCLAMPSAAQPSALPTPPHHWRRLYHVPSGTQPGQGPDVDTLVNAAATGVTIPFWKYSIVSPLDGKSYSGSMVGRSPFFHGHRSTVVNTLLIPVVLTFADTGAVFDPSVSDACLGDSVVNVTKNSPMFQNVDYVMNGDDMGSTQYVDAFQRSNFWGAVSGTPYHTVLGGKILSPVSVTVPTANGSTNVGSLCGYFGTMDFGWWDNYVQQTLMPQLASQGVNLTSFPIFLFDSVFEYQNNDPSQCCVLGYHNSFTKSNLLQTYSISSFDTTGSFGGDISTTSHEIAEWMDDPNTSNPTPSWGHTGQTSGCQNNLEVGDPLTGTEWGTVTIGNNAFNVQELAFYSWFFRQSPSVGAAGYYSNNATFTDAQGACQ